MMFSEAKIKYLISELLRLESRHWTEWCCDCCPLEECEWDKHPISEGKCMHKVLEFLKEEDEYYEVYDYPFEDE